MGEKKGKEIVGSDLEAITQELKGYEKRFQQLKTYRENYLQKIYGYRSINSALAQYFLSQEQLEEKNNNYTLPALETVHANILQTIFNKYAIIKETIKRGEREKSKKMFYEIKEYYSILITYLSLVEAFPEVKVPELYGRKYVPLIKSEPPFPDIVPIQEGYYEEFYKKNYSESINYAQEFIKRLAQEKKISKQQLAKIKQEFIKKYLS